MLVLRPRRVMFNTAVWTDVESISVNRRAARLVTDFSDSGPHVAFADVPEQLVEIELVQLLTADYAHQLPLGTMGDLGFSTAPTASDAATERFTVRCVVASVQHTVSRQTARRVVRLVAVSADGSSDPVIREPGDGAGAPGSEPGPEASAEPGTRVSGAGGRAVVRGGAVRGMGRPADRAASGGA